ncbi:hypothetical protein PR202_gb13265 [Eleusine coracana subsp. coracana]|uniref:Uncharacterized protein n=1 Tax=Eleusine coracana subsp. coracana TaxID=191504 RepID=A0AAV5EPW5_ELECO|nr:hypothetical protein QOZ80_9BG0712640 [Eleusine coracana subsp. coracana]GJN25438.1 hypothetical protein PR202_gb13265 [Eleusine coracana subsp. coracana]
MKITVQSSKLVKPYHGRGIPSIFTNSAIPLTVLDKVTYDEYACLAYFFHPPATPNSILEMGFIKALAVYREWAGRLGVDANGVCSILLNDAGARFVTATADVALSCINLLQPTPELLSCLCPSDYNTEELMLVQITQFACGSFALGVTAHHTVADGYGMVRFGKAWGKATRGLAIDPILLVHHRASIFAPRVLPRVEFEHRGAEFKRREEEVCINQVHPSDKVVAHTAHFNPEMLSELKRRMSAGRPRPYSTFYCITAHLWRCITKVRGLHKDKVTKLIIPVNGRLVMRHLPMPMEYTGNVVLWAQATTTVGELLAKPLRHAVELISREVARIDDSYFRSFIDFASSGAVEKESLVPTASLAKTMDHSTSVFVSNLKGIPVYDLDFGAGRPFFCTRVYHPQEGFISILPPFASDGSMDVQVGLFRSAIGIFEEFCYSLLTPNAKL